MVGWLGGWVGGWVVVVVVVVVVAGRVVEGVCVGGVERLWSSLRNHDGPRFRCVTWRCVVQTWRRCARCAVRRIHPRPSQPLAHPPRSPRTSMHVDAHYQPRRRPVPHRMRASSRCNASPSRAHPPTPSRATHDGRARQFVRAAVGTPSAVVWPFVDTSVDRACPIAWRSASRARFGGIAGVCRASRDVATARVVGLVHALVASWAALPLGGGCAR